MNLKTFKEKNPKKNLIIGVSIVFVLLLTIVFVLRSYAVYEEKSEYDVIEGKVPSYLANYDVKVNVVVDGVGSIKIPEKGTKKVIYEGTSIETLQQLEKILGTLTELNKKRILEIANTFPPDTIKGQIKGDWCYIYKTFSDLKYGEIFRISELTKSQEDNLIRLSKDANRYYQEKIKNNQ